MLKAYEQSLKKYLRPISLIIVWYEPYLTKCFIPLLFMTSVFEDLVIVKSLMFEYFTHQYMSRYKPNSNVNNRLRLLNIYHNA